MSDWRSCPHGQVSKRMIVIQGRTYNDTFCLLCGLNISALVDRSRESTWADSDTTGKKLKGLEDRRQRSLAVAQAEQRERMSNTTARTFECTVGGSSKFWKVWRSEKIQMVLFGPIGTAGQARQKECLTIAAANRSIADLIRKKLRKGYVEIKPSLADTFDAFRGSTQRATESSGSSVRNSTDWYPTGR